MQAGNEVLELLWGAEQIASAIQRTPRQVNHLLSTGCLPGAKKIGNRWCITRRALLAAFDAPAPTSVKS